MSRADNSGELAPFVAGQEYRTFGAAEFDALVGHLEPKVRARTVTAARLVLVDKMPYKSAAMVAGESQSFVRGATLGVLERLGYTGPGVYLHDPATSLVLRRIPAKYHKALRELVVATVAKWESDAVASAFEGFPEVDLGDSEVPTVGTEIDKLES